MTSTDPHRHDHARRPAAQPGGRPRGHRHRRRYDSAVRRRPGGHGRLSARSSSGLLFACPRSAGGGARSADFAARPAGRAVARGRRISRRTSVPRSRSSAREETQALDGYGWVNQPGGVTHIPVDEAKKLLVAARTPGAPGRGRSARRHACLRDGRGIGRTHDRRQTGRARPRPARSADDSGGASATDRAGSRFRAERSRGS